MVHNFVYKVCSVLTIKRLNDNAAVLPYLRATLRNCPRGVNSVKAYLTLTLIVLGDRMLQSVGVGSIVPAGFSTSFNIVLI